LQIVKAGAILIIYLFIVLIAFFTISTPFDEIMSGVEDADTGAAEPYIAEHSGWYRILFNMFFAMFGIAPMVWFVVWVFHREPDWGYRRY